MERLIGKLGLSGAVRGKRRRTPTPDTVAQRSADLVERDFNAPAPNRLWVADLTYAGTWSGFALRALHHRRLHTLHRRLPSA